jgi:hypothetical protein
MSRSQWLTGMFSTSQQLEAERQREMYRRLQTLERAAALDVRKGVDYDSSAVYTLVPDSTGHPAETAVIDSWAYAGDAGVLAGQTAYIMITLSISPDASQPIPFPYSCVYLDHAPAASTDWPPTYSFFAGWNSAYRSGAGAWPARNPTTLPNTMGPGGGFFAIPIKADAAAPTISLRMWAARISNTPTLVSQNTIYITDIAARAFLTG